MTVLNQPKPEIQRDRYGRPLVIPPGGGKPTPYTRCTTYIDVLEDKYNLQQWMQRMVAIGLSTRPDLLLAVSAHKDDKKALNGICEQAREAAAATASATTGTALHALTELPDRGLDLPVIPPGPKASIDAYVTATAALKVVHIEQFLVLDHLKIGGTADRIVKDEGELRIADIKTGSIEYGALKIAMQLAIYARSHLYDIPTGERTIPGLDMTTGIVIHLPATDDPTQARCDLYRVNLEAGWYAVNVATQVREKRKLKFGDLMEPYATLPTLDDTKPSWNGVNRTLAEEPAPLEEQIKACGTADAVRALWATHQDVWTDHLTEVAQAHITSLPAAS